MAAYLHLVLSLKSKLSCCDFKRVQSLKNNHANSLVNLTSATEYQFRQEIPVEHIAKPSIQRHDKEIHFLDSSPGWRDIIIAYLKDKTLPNDKAEAQKLQHMATRYVLIGDLLYKKSYCKLYSNPYLRCLGSNEARRVVQEINDDDCEKHAGGRSLAYKVINQEY